MSKINFQKEMLGQVATALDELLPQVVFIGGCTIYVAIARLCVRRMDFGAIRIGAIRKA